MTETTETAETRETAKTTEMTEMTKEEKYEALLPAVHSLMSGEPDEIARMANLAALLHSEFGFWWTGFYRVESKTGDRANTDSRRNTGSGASGDELVLGPFQGPLACTRIPLGKGVCGTAWAEGRTVVVPDVEKFPGHIACSSESRSEIVVPVRSHGQIIAVLDIDSRELATFDGTDALWLGKIADCLYGPDGPAAENAAETADEPIAENTGETSAKDPLRDIWFAAGCFWGAQKFFKMVPGVAFTEVGFANGWVQNPSYKQVYSDTTGHAECVHVRYNPEEIPLKELVQLYFRIIDPLSLNKQGEDEGTRYRTGVYYEDERDLDILSEEFSRLEKELGRASVVELGHLQSFYKAEEYHQDYLDKTPGGYCHLSPELFNLAAKYRKK